MNRDNLGTNNLKTTLTDILINRFHSMGIKTIFAIPGGHVDHLLKRLTKDGRFRLVLAAHEEGAAYMADGYARISNHPALVITINGPGVTNLITAAVTARVDHSPVIFLSGDAPSFLEGYDAFQSSDPQVSNSSALMEQALGYSFDLSESTDILNVLRRFDELSLSTYPVPIHINFPLDRADYKIEEPTSGHHIDETCIDRSLDTFPDALPVKSLILVGEGITRQSDFQSIAEFSREFEIPIAVTMSAKNIQPLIDESLYLGVFGYGGGPRASKAVLEPSLDLILFFGVHLNERNTVLWHPDFFNPKRTIVAINPFSGSKCLNGLKYHELSGHVSDMITMLDEHWINSLRATTQVLRKQWCDELLTRSRIPISNNQFEKNETDGRLTMETLVKILNHEMPVNTCLFLDSGDHRIYGSTYWEVKTPNSFFTAAQTAPMGWAIAAAIGASFEVEDTPICVITGDGCMLMHGMEIAIAAKHHRKVIFIVCNNGTYGRVAVRLKHEPQEVRDTITNLPKVCWADFARSLGVSSCVVTDTDILSEAIGRALKEDGPFLMDVMTTIDEYVPYPEAVFSSSMPGFAEVWNKRKTDLNLDQEE